MSENLKAVIAVGAGTIVLIICYIRLIFKGRSKSYKERFIERAKAEGNVAEATLVDTKLRLGNDESNNSYYKNDLMKATYQYTVRGKTYKKKLKFQSPGMVSVKYPYSVKVYYNEKNPAKGVCLEEAGSSGCATTMLLTVLTIIAVYGLLKLV